MNKQIIALLGTLALVVSFGARATVTQEIFDRLDNDSNYNSLNVDEQATIDNTIEQTVSNLEDKGINLTDSNAQMFLIDTVTKFLGLSKAKEDAKKMPPAEPVAAANAAPGDLLLVDANGQYFLIDSITNIIGKVVDAGKNLLGLGDKPAATPPSSGGTIFNAMDNGLSMNDANAHYGAIWDAIKGVGAAVADKVGSLAEKVSDKLKPKPTEEPAAGEGGNSLDSQLSLVDANAHYGAVTDALKGLVGAVADKVGSLAGKVSDKLKPKPAEEPAPAEMPE